MLSAGTENLLGSTGPFCRPEFAEGEEGRDWFLNSKILVIGAGGLGCELLKALALTGFRNIDVIDMDIIDISNLNRQFLFRKSDVGQPKSVVAANFIRKRVPGININAHFCKIQDFDDEYYKQFSVVIGGLDSITARNWMNDELVKLARDSNGQVYIPYIDGGTEEWKGHVKVVFPNETACMRCQESLFPPPTVFQDCTVASYPRQPEHCVIWAKEMAWREARPKEEIDGDNDEHIEWIMNKAKEHQAKFNVEGNITMAYTRGVVKNIIPAIASTQAIIAAMCTTEALKLVTAAGPTINNNVLFAGDDRINVQNFLFERNPECPSCSRKILKYPPVDGENLQALMERLKMDKGYNITSLLADGVYIYAPFMTHTHDNLTKPVEELLKNQITSACYKDNTDNTIQFEFLVDYPE